MKQSHKIQIRSDLDRIGDVVSRYFESAVYEEERMRKQGAHEAEHEWRKEVHEVYWAVRRLREIAEEVRR